MMSSSANLAEKPRLTEEEKKQNHIQSEQKRRQAIREGFDQLCTIVPGMANQGRSEAVVMSATLDYLKAQLADKESLRERAMDMNMSEGDFEHMYRSEGIRANSAQDEDEREQS